MEKVIHIVGGGLTGLSLGTALALRGVGVRVSEAGTYPRHKVCGEFLSGIRRETLEALGVGDCLDRGVRLETMAWIYRGRVCFERNLPVAATGLSRWTLDAELRDRAVDAGCEVTTGAGVPRRGDPRLEAGDGEVWCGGRRRQDGEWIGLKAHYEGFTPVADLEMHLGKRCYVGVSRVEGGRVNVCGLFPSSAGRGRGAEPLLRALEASGLRSLGGRLGSARQVESSACAVAGFRCGWQRDAGVGFRAGDASVMIPPFTGNGMSMAFEAAASAVEPLDAWVRGRIEWSTAVAESRRGQARAFQRRMWWASLLHPWILDPVGQWMLSGLAARGWLPVASLFRWLR